MTLKLWQFLQHKLQQQMRCALLTVLDCKGSTPAKTGAQMVLSLDGETLGTIGGGAIEYALSKETKKLFISHSQKIVHRHIVTDKIGMLCGGQQDIAICILEHNDLALVERILTCLQQDDNGFLIIQANKLSFTDKGEPSYEYHNPNHWFYQQNITDTARVFIIGGGHVSLALSEVLKFLDFHITIIDTRPELELLKQNHFADIKRIIPHYQEISEYIPEGLQHYVIIMTHSHHSDGIALEQLLNKQFAYLGMMGSQRKIAVLFSQLQDKGFSESQLSKVHAPIGLAIACQNPKEIAMSIAAQLIQQKNLFSQPENGELGTFVL